MLFAIKLGSEWVSHFDDGLLMTVADPSFARKFSVPADLHSFAASNEIADYEAAVVDEKALAETTERLAREMEDKRHPNPIGFILMWPGALLPYYTGRSFPSWTSDLDKAKVFESWSEVHDFVACTGPSWLESTSVVEVYG